MTKLFFAFLLVGFLGCAGTVGDDPANPEPSWGSDGGAGFNNNDPGSDSMVEPPADTSQPPDADQPKPDADQAKCVKNNDGTCCLEGQPCATPDAKCKAGQKTIFRCNTDTCTTRVDCVDVDPVEPECVLKNGVCCLGDDCDNTTINVTCADGFKPGDLYCTKTCMPMRDCVEIETDCVTQGTTCCVGQFCTSVENVCDPGETQEFVGCSTPNCIPVFDCI